jgi:hypothetical protein
MTNVLNRATVALASSSLKSCLQTSPPATQKSYPKFRNPRTVGQLFKMSPISAQKRRSVEGRGQTLMGGR